MSILSFPQEILDSVGVTQGSFSLVPNTQTFTSPLNKTAQTGELPGARWIAKFVFDDIFGVEARIIKAWLASLRGSAGRFYLGDLTHRTPSGTALGTPLVKGAAQVGATLLTGGWTANQTALLLRGDYFAVNGELKIITAAAASDALGNATLTFEPPLRSSPLDNSAITVASPTCTMRLENDEQDKLMFHSPKITSFELNAVEIF